MGCEVLLGRSGSGFYCRRAGMFSIGGFWDSKESRQGLRETTGAYELSYVAVDNDIWTSTVLKQGPVVVSTWLLLMASADRYGITRATPSSVASVLRIKDEDAEKAFKVLLSPDTRSRNKESKGARMTEMDDGAFLLVSFAKYKKKASKQAAARRQKEYEDRVKAGQPVKDAIRSVLISAEDMDKDTVTIPPVISHADIQAIRAQQAADLAAAEITGNLDAAEHIAAQFADPDPVTEEPHIPESVKAKPREDDGRIRCGQMNVKGHPCLKWRMEGRMACLEHMQLGALGATPPLCAMESCSGFAATPNTSFCLEHYVQEASE